tara:strand:- start:1333 stop:2040 length:708 start_codon:yes stop_codon:yes gene_type:complete
MSVDVNTVYSRVLAIMNKEQRGYVTPQEFNIYANQAQMDIFEQYFYDLNQFLRLPGNSTGHADMVDLLNEKIGIFTKTAALVYGSSSFNKPTDIYRLTAIEYNGVIADRLTRKEYLQVNKSPLTKPSDSFPVYTELANGYDVQGDDEFTGSDQSGDPKVNIEYIKRPAAVSWSGTEVSGSLLYNSTNSIHFELHDSEETEIIMKILELAGIAIKQIDIANFAGSEEIKKVQLEKA